MTSRGGLLKLDAICAKLVNVCSRTEEDATIVNKALNCDSDVSSPANGTADVSCRSTLNDASSTTSALKDDSTMRRLMIPSADDVMTSSVHDDITDLELTSCRSTQDLASSNSSSLSTQSTAAADDATQSRDVTASGGSSDPSAPGGRRKRRKNARPKNLGQMREYEADDALDLKYLASSKQHFESCELDHNADFDVDTSGFNPEGVSESHDVDEDYARSMHDTRASTEHTNADQGLVLNLSMRKPNSEAEGNSTSGSSRLSYQTDDCGALDLSMNSSGHSQSGANSSVTSRRDDVDQTRTAAHTVDKRRDGSTASEAYMSIPTSVCDVSADMSLQQDQGSSSSGGAGVQQHADAHADELSASQSIAESTFHDCLKMYGLGASGQSPDDDATLQAAFGRLAAGALQSSGDDTAGIREALQSSLSRQQRLMMKRETERRTPVDDDVDEETGSLSNAG